MAKLVLFNKPYGVLSQFTPEAGHISLANYLDIPGVYAAGRLDVDSEGLLVLTDDGSLQKRIADPEHKMAKVYWAQVEGLPSTDALSCLMSGLNLGDFVTQPCEARLIAEPAALWPRNPSIRARKNIPTAWLEIVLKEGKNRQVRRMTAKAGYPTLRLIRAAIGPWRLDTLRPGEWRSQDL